MFGCMLLVAAWLRQYIGGTTENHSIVWLMFPVLGFVVVTYSLNAASQTYVKIQAEMVVIFSFIIYLYMGADEYVAILLYAGSCACFVATALARYTPEDNLTISWNIAFMFLAFKILFYFENGMIPPLPVEAQFITPGFQLALWAILLICVWLFLCFMAANSVWKLLAVVLMLDGIFSVSVFAFHFQWVSAAGILQMILSGYCFQKIFKENKKNEV